MLLMAGIAAGTVLLLVLILLLISKCGGTAVIREESSGTSVSQEPGSAPVSDPLPAGPTVPNVKGMDAEAAEQTLRDAGYEVSFREAYDESVPTGSVAAQDPAPDSPLDAGGEVRLTVSLGPDLSDTVADWQEPVIETAVRICLGNGTGDILVSDLDAVTTLVLDGGTCRVNTDDTGRSEDETGGPLRLDDLKYFRNLRGLYLYGQDLSSLEPVRGMTGLETLTVCGGSVSDLSPLAGLRSLTALTVTDCGVRSAAPLEGLEQLVLLDLSENPLGGAETVSGLTGLKILRLNGCGIADLMPLVSLTGLSELQLADNEVTDPAALTGMKELTALSLAGNPLGSPGRLQELTSLTTLDLSRTGLTSLAGLEKLTALEALGLSDNELTSIAELASMPRLKTLFIDRVPVRDFSPLYGCRELTYISALKAQNSVGSLVDPYRELRSRLPNCEIVTK